MNKTATLAGAVVVLLVAAAWFYFEWGQHIELRGRILDARVHAATENDSVVVVDAELTNPADVNFEVDNTEAIVVPDAGEEVSGGPVAAVDAAKVMEAFPLLKGSSDMPLLTLTSVLKPHETVRRRLTFQFAGLPAKSFDKRKSLVVKIRERLGAVAELR
jgi:hypothetical protein